MAAHKKYLTEEERLQARRETKKRWEEAHKEERKEYFKKNKAEYYQSHKEKIAEYCKANKEKRAAKQAEWHKANRDNNPIKYRANYLIQGYKKEDRKKGRISNELPPNYVTVEDVIHLITKKCAHFDECGTYGWRKIGLNRLDNSKPHTIDNVEPCCLKCNMKISGGRPKKKIGLFFD